MSGEIVKLRALCRKWGGDLLKVSDSKYERLAEGRFKEKPTFFAAPFTNWPLGIAWDRKRVYYTAAGRLKWPAIIHEMGHCFASARNPWKSDEFSFLGWEWAVVSCIGASQTLYLKDNAIYQLGSAVAEASELGMLPPRRQREFMNEQLQEARKAGLVRGCKPLAIR